MRMYRLAVVGSMAWLAGCTGAAPEVSPGKIDVGASGLPLSSYMDELSEAHKRTFCMWQATLYGGEGVSLPCGKSTYTLPSTDDCAHSPTAFLHVPVEVTEQCISDLKKQGDVCTLPHSEACDEVAEARAQKPPSNGSCSDDRWSTDGCATPDFF